MKNEIKINEIIYEFDKLTITNKLSIPFYTSIFTYDENEHTFYILFEFVDNSGITHNNKMFDVSFFHALEKYSDWKILLNNSNFNDFIRELYFYIEYKKHEYNRILNALMSNYSPIENVDEYTTEIMKKTGTIGNVSNGSVTIGERNATATDNNVTSTGYVSVYDNANDVQNNRNVASGSTSTHSDNATDTNSTTNTETLNTNDEFTRRRHGNIGVTKSTELANDEITFRLNMNFVDIVVFGFINYACYLVEGIE